MKQSAAALFPSADKLHIRSVLTHGDLLESEAGQRHRGPLLSIARKIWPRRLIKTVAPGAGLFMLISGRKPARGN